MIPIPLKWQYAVPYRPPTFLHYPHEQRMGQHCPPHRYGRTSLSDRQHTDHVCSPETRTTALPAVQKNVEVTDDIRALIPGHEPDNIYGPNGCDHCYYTGYSGRQAVYEVIPLDDELAHAARNSAPDIDHMLKKRGIIPLREAGINMFLNGATSVDELIPLLKA